MPSANDLLTVATAAAQAAGAYLRSVDRPRDPASLDPPRAGPTGPRRWTGPPSDMISRILTDGGPRIARRRRGTEPRGGAPAGWCGSWIRWMGRRTSCTAFPAFAVSIAAAVDGVLEAGAVLHVPLDRLTTATRGGGAFGGRSSPAASPHRRPGACPDRHRLPLPGVHPGSMTIWGSSGAWCSARQASAGRARPPSTWPMLPPGDSRGSGSSGSRPGTSPRACSSSAKPAGRVTDFAGARPRHRAQRGRGRQPAHPPLAAGGAQPTMVDTPIAWTTFAGGGRSRALRRPRGGAVAAVTASLAAALTAMVARLALEQDPWSGAAFAHGARGLIRPAASPAPGAGRRGRGGLPWRSWRRAALAMSRPRWQPGGDAGRVPAEVVRLSREVAQLAWRAAREGPPSALGDAVMAALLAAAAGRVSGQPAAQRPGRRATRGSARPGGSLGN